MWARLLSDYSVQSQVAGLSIQLGTYTSKVGDKLISRHSHGGSHHMTHKPQWIITSLGVGVEGWKGWEWDRSLQTGALWLVPISTLLNFNLFATFSFWIYSIVWSLTFSHQKCFVVFENSYFLHWSTCILNLGHICIIQFVRTHIF